MTPRVLTGRPLDFIFSPRSIAVVGASRRRDSIGFALLHNLIEGEFQGTIFPVNPKAGVIHSLKAYPDLASVPDPVDLAIVMVPRDAVLGVVEDCLETGVGGLVVITAGFAETGGEGVELERTLRQRVRAGGVRMVGPNCMGVINADPEVSMNATFSPTPARRGSIGFVSQSGALGVAILNAASDLGIGLTQFTSMGNKADVSGNDLVEYLEDDEDTRVICMYLESFGNPRKFTQIAKRVGRKKPILIVKSGRTAEGARAATSHTGAIAGPDLTVSALLARCGVLRANTIGELFDVARALDHCPLPAGNRVAILTNAGGPAIMATDACVNQGLMIASLGEDTRTRLGAFLPAEASLANPVDMIASATEESYAKGLEALLDDDGVDMVLVINVTPLLSNPIDVIHAVGEVAKTSKGKPVLAVMMATEEFYDEVKRRPDLPPVYRFPESASRALAQLDRYATWRRQPEVEMGPSYPVDTEAVEEILSRVNEGYLPSRDAFQVLEHYRIPVAPYRWAATREGVAAAAREVGFPVAIKAEAAGLVHKSDIGAVRLGIETEEAVEPVLLQIEDAMAEGSFTPEGFLVQRMGGPGHEVIYGISTDSRFGPIVMFGLGGRYVEVFRDVRFGVTPLSAVEAEEVVRGIRGFPLLEGVRGESAADLEVLVEVLRKVAQLAEHHPRILELDINPFVAAPERNQAQALDVRIRVGDGDKR
ncbi:MAG: acetate--CoA ligase family protein [Acidobacteriota bacterium]|nr:acetate--CoA ligase family protein [Acidobacteriota bacterium]